jgi:hypothetical protein
MLNVGGNDIRGVTSLDDHLYTVQYRSTYIDVYDTVSLTSQRRLHVPGLRQASDMTSCSRYRCLYVADWTGVVHRVEVPDGGVTKWRVKDYVRAVSVTPSCSLLITCSESRKLKEFDTRGDLLRTINLGRDVVSPWHAVKLTTGQFVVCHGGTFDIYAPHRLCMLGADGFTRLAYGGIKGSATGQLNCPVHLAVDTDSGGIFVADRDNKRVLFIDHHLRCDSDVMSRDEGYGKPQRLCWEGGSGRLYVVNGTCINVFAVKNTATENL